ncbi:hypothetical protein DsansV1_C49g0244061 [Dioscorea sansibarensis]
MHRYRTLVVLLRISFVGFIYSLASRSLNPYSQSCDCGGSIDDPWPAAETPFNAFLLFSCQWCPGGWEACEGLVGG